MKIIINKKEIMKTRKPTHPGEILLEEVIKPLGLTITEAARDLGVSRKTLSEIIHGKCRLTPETAVRIGLATDTSPESWLNMQTKLDLWEATNSKSVQVTKFAAMA
jgi:antitoxin HigA-1